MINVLFFGRVADIMRKRKVTLTLSETVGSLFSLRDHLFNDAAESNRMATQNIQMSVNQAITRSDLQLNDGDEVAFFSVFSGG